MAALLVERATHPAGPYGRAPTGPLLSSSIYLLGGGAYGRAPKGPYQSSPLKGPLPYGRACFRILNSRACFRILMVEHLKVQFTYWALK